MSDPFNILGPEFDIPPTFQEAVRDALARLQAAAGRFEDLAGRVPEDAYSDDEWRVVERAAEDAAEAVERAEDGYVAVQYDSHAWYRIIENLETVRLRLESAAGLMELVLERQRNESG